MAETKVLLQLVYRSFRVNIIELNTQRSKQKLLHLRAPLRIIAFCSAFEPPRCDCKWTCFANKYNKLVSLGLSIFCFLMATCDGPPHVDSVIYIDCESIVGSEGAGLLHFGFPPCTESGGVLYGLSWDPYRRNVDVLGDVVAVETEVTKSNQGVLRADCGVTLRLPIKNIDISRKMLIGAYGSVVFLCGVGRNSSVGGSRAYDSYFEEVVSGHRKITLAELIMGDGECLDVLLPSEDVGLALCREGSQIKVCESIIGKDVPGPNPRLAIDIDLSERLGVGADVAGLVRSSEEQVVISLNACQFDVAIISAGSVEWVTFRFTTGLDGLVNRWHVARTADGFAIIYEWRKAFIGDQLWGTSIAKFDWSGSLVGVWAMPLEIDWYKIRGVLFVGECVLVSGVKYNPSRGAIYGLRLSPGFQARELFRINNKSGSYGGYYGVMIIPIDIDGKKFLAIMDPHVPADSSEPAIRLSEDQYISTHAALKLVDVSRLAAWIDVEAWGG